MPNHCANCLYIYGTREDRDTFIQKVCSIENMQIELDLQKIMPLSENANTYDGHIKTWGTKWNCYKTEIHYYDDYDKIYFLTAWCPYKIDVQYRMSKMFRTLQFRLLFAERGKEFQGEYKSEYSHFCDKVILSSHIKNCDVKVKVLNDDNWEFYLENSEYNELYQKSG